MRTLPTTGRRTNGIGVALAAAMASAPMTAIAAGACGVIPTPQDLGVPSYTLYNVFGDTLMNPDASGLGFKLGRHIHGYFILSGNTKNFSGTVTSASLGLTAPDSLLWYALASDPTCFRSDDTSVTGTNFSVTLAKGHVPTLNVITLQESFSYQGNSGLALFELHPPSDNDNDFDAQIDGVGGFVDTASAVVDISHGKVYLNDQRPVLRAGF